MIQFLHTSLSEIVRLCNILANEEYTSLLKLKTTLERKIGILEKENRTKVDEDKTGIFNSLKDYINLFDI